MRELLNAEAIVHEARSERMEQRIKPTIKRTIEMAAALSGTDTSDFVTTAAYAEALRRLEEASLVRLSAVDSRSLFAALDSAEGPNDAMMALVADYVQGVDDPIR